MSEVIWVVRHASTDWTRHRWCGSTDLGLNDRGRKEARLLARSLVGRVTPGAPILTSPLRRATETAAIVGSAISSRPRIDDRLREIDFGAAEGLDWPGLVERHPVLARSIETDVDVVDWPGGESGRQVVHRAERAWRHLKDGPDEVILVSHGGFLRALLGEALADGGGQVPRLAPGGFVGLVRRRDGWRIG